MSNWQTHLNEIKDLLLSLSVTDINGHDIDTDTAFKQLQNYALGVLERRKTIYFIGNGGSASIANEVSANLAANTGIHTETFFNFALLTLIASKSDYDEIFAEPLRKRMVAGDMLVAICSSGESKNIINAVEEAQKIGGIVCTLSAMNPENTLRSLGTINFYVTADKSMIVNLGHIEILNYWSDQMISMVSWQEKLKERCTGNDIIGIAHSNLNSN
jgi:D-sedoheptulose 7-phosphate isomerase